MDRYYTPEPLAKELLQQCSFSKGGRVIDPSCGAGSLLAAAETVLATQGCFGIDLDRSAIMSLRRRKPHWHLSVANLLSTSSVRRSTAGRIASEANVLLMNPPFSQAGRKYVEFRRQDGNVIRVGQAMQFLLNAIDLFNPNEGIFAILPESLAFSEIDAEGRELISSRFEMREIATLKSTTFRGTRARTIAVEFALRAGTQPIATLRTPASTTVRLQRGSLPVHLAVRTRNGVPFVHSSDLLTLASGRFDGDRVELGRHAFSGWVLLLPRVGVPRQAAVKAVHIKHAIRLSDCVLGVWCKNRESAKSVENLIHKVWIDFISLYRGTGARYVTVSRLTAWFAELGVDTEVV